MTKKEVAWLLIRLAGVWLLWQAAEGGLSFVSTYLQVSLNSELLARSTGVFLQLALHIVVNFTLGLYCIFGGNALFQVLNSESEQETVSILDSHK